MQNQPVETQANPIVVELIKKHYGKNPLTILHVEGLKTALGLIGTDTDTIHSACVFLVEENVLRSTMMGHRTIFLAR